MDYASPFPRFERLKNYIQFVNEQKFHEEAMKFAGGRRGVDRQTSIISKISQAKKMKPAE